jgi:hypothetical protein
MKNTPCYMRSIWASDYSSCEKIIQLNENNNNDDTVLKDTNRINTKGLEKTIDTNKLIKKKGKSNDNIKSSPAIATSSPSYVKRKFENDENKLEAKTPMQKKFKLADIKVDIDNLLGEYTLNVSDTEEEDDVSINQSSSYFSSSNQMSPILTKVNEFFLNRQKF